MNPFDAVVMAVTIVAMVLGFAAGLLRSLATILGYLIAVPLAVAVTPRILPFVAGRIAPDNAWIPPFVVMIGAGFLLGALFRIIVAEFTGPEIGLFDRVGGAALGAVRIFLVAVLIVVVFDRLIPADRQPEFLNGSMLRPYLSSAGQKGMQSLPPDIEDYIDRLKRQRAF